jgi:NADPH:quinone reductase-like Zn-dependent oxidoreductase
VLRHRRRGRRGRHRLAGRGPGLRPARGGGYAEKVAVPAGQLLPAPKALTLAEAAALPETVCTVYANVFLGALAPDGRIANIGLQQGTRAELDFRALMAKRGTIMSTTLRARPVAQKASIVAAVTANVWPLVDTGALRPVIYRELPMAQASEAHRIMTASTHTGKIVLRAE